jgi:hypothetical protein
MASMVRRVLFVIAPFGIAGGALFAWVWFVNFDDRVPTAKQHYDVAAEEYVVGPASSTFVFHCAAPGRKPIEYFFNESTAVPVRPFCSPELARRRSLLVRGEVLLAVGAEIALGMVMLLAARRRASDAERTSRWMLAVVAAPFVAAGLALVAWAILAPYPAFALSRDREGIEQPRELECRGLGARPGLTHRSGVDRRSLDRVPCVAERGKRVSTLWRAEVTVGALGVLALAMVLLARRTHPSPNWASSQGV